MAYTVITRLEVVLITIRKKARKSWLECGKEEAYMKQLDLRKEIAGREC